MSRVCVTGGSGGAGRALIEDLLAHGYDCVNLDLLPPDQHACPFIKTNLSDYSAVLRAMEGSDALVHFAGQPHPDSDHWAGAERFANNTVTQFNAINAAAEHRITRVVWASSETIYGYPFANGGPVSVPLSETSLARPETGYGVSKAASELVAELMVERYRMTIIGLRLSNILFDDPSVLASFTRLPEYWSDPHIRKSNLWGYIDSRDAARAVRLALERPLTGAHVFNIAAMDTVMWQDTRALLEAVMPQISIDSAISARSALLDCSRARDLLGWVPEIGWPDVLGIDPAELALGVVT